MPKYIPGNPRFIVQNMPGAGSVVATNFVYSVAKPDGLTIGFPSSGIYLDQLVGRAEVKFDIRKFAWIGSPVKEPMIFYMRSDSPVQNDLRRQKRQRAAEMRLHRHGQHRFHPGAVAGRHLAAAERSIPFWAIRAAPKSISPWKKAKSSAAA